jgi:hypothetical protein
MDKGGTELADDSAGYFVRSLTTRRNLEDQRCRLNRREIIECYI